MAYVHFSIFIFFSQCLPSEHTVVFIEHILCARLSCKHRGFCSESHRQKPCHYRASILVKDTDDTKSKYIVQQQNMADAQRLTVLTALNEVVAMTSLSWGIWKKRMFMVGNKEFRIGIFLAHSGNSRKAYVASMERRREDSRQAQRGSHG